MNFSMIIYVLGWVLKLEAGIMILPIICALIYQEFWAVQALAVSAVLALVIGTLATVKGPKRTDYYAREGFVICALSWIVMSMRSSRSYPALRRPVPRFLRRSSTSARDFFSGVPSATGSAAWAFSSWF